MVASLPEAAHDLPLHIMNQGPALLQVMLEQWLHSMLMATLVQPCIDHLCKSSAYNKHRHVPPCDCLSTKDTSAHPTSSAALDLTNLTHMSRCPRPSCWPKRPFSFMAMSLLDLAGAVLPWEPPQPTCLLRGCRRSSKVSLWECTLGERSLAASTVCQSLSAAFEPGLLLGLVHACC